MSAVATNFSLTVGEWYDYGKETDPRTMNLLTVGGTFLGYVKPLGFLVFQGADLDGENTGEITFVNPANVYSLRPETLPKELS